MGNSEFVKDCGSFYEVSLILVGNKDKLRVDIVDDKVLRVFFNISNNAKIDSMTYTFNLPKDSNTDSIIANLVNDLLVIKIDKKEENIKNIPIIIV